MAKRKKEKMSDVLAEAKAEATAEVVAAKENTKNQVTLEITRPADGSYLNVFVKAPVVAAIVRKMAPSNYIREGYSDIYKPILVALAETGPGKDRVVTRAAIGKATKNFVGGQDFLFTEPPRTILLANPDMLEAGFTLQVKLEAPVPPDVLRKWGKQFMDGCSDIITNARPFKMAWVMDEVGAPVK